MEYAYRHANDYDLIWWLRAEDATTLAADFASLATSLKLPEKDTADQNVVIAAVRNWLNQHTSWLLIFDNASSVEELRRFLPQAATGHVLITSRLRQWHSLASTFGIEVWESQEAIDFLCRRTGQNDTVTAQALAEELCYLPLALAQAAAYITAAEISLHDYLQRFQQLHLKILNRSKPETDYPHTVATTWELSFQQAIKHSPAAAELLNVCAFLAPDEISRNLLFEGLQAIAKSSNLALAEALVFDEAIVALRSVSLLEATPDMLSVHRLVQVVTHGRLSEEERKRWVKEALKLMNHIFPFQSDDVRFWPQCAVLLPHAQAVIANGEELQATLYETACLLNKIGLYLHERADYAEAEPLYYRSLAIYEKQLGPEHPDVAASLNNLAALLQSLGKYTEAETFCRRSLTIYEKQLEPDHPHVATSLNNLAALLGSQGKYKEAELLNRSSLAIYEQYMGPEHPNVAASLNNLAESLEAQGKYAETEPLFRRSLRIRENQLGPEHPDVAISLNNLAGLLESQGKYAEAEPLYRRSLEIREQQLRPEHPHVADSLNKLAELLRWQGKSAEAEPLSRRSLAICEKTLGPKHPHTQAAQNNLTLLLEEMRGK